MKKGEETMNKAEVVALVSEKSGVNAADCQKVLDMFEQVLSDELANSKRVGDAFDKVYNILSFFKNKKHT